MENTFLELLNSPSMVTTTAASDYLMEGFVQQFHDCFGEEELADDSEPGTKVVLDVVVDGYRYTMTRTYCGPGKSSAGLSPREREIIRLIARGMPNKTVARALNISPYTVATHLKRIFAKLGVSSRAEMVARAFELAS